MQICFHSITINYFSQGLLLSASLAFHHIVSAVQTVTFHFCRSMIADSAIIGFCTQRVIFITTYLQLEVSYVSTQNEVQYIVKAFRYNISKNQENFSGQRWLQELKVGGVEVTDDRSLADYISGSQTAANVGHGLRYRESRPKTYHELNSIGHWVQLL